MATRVNTDSQYIGSSANSQIVVLPGYEENIEDILQRIYPGVDAHQAMSGFERGAELLQAVYSDLKKSSSLKKNAEIMRVLSDYQTLMNDALLTVRQIVRTSQKVLTTSHGDALQLIEENKNAAATKLANLCKKPAGEIGDSISKLKANASALKDKALVVLTAASQKPELIKEIELLFDRAVIYLACTEDHCRHLSKMDRDTKEKIGQSAWEWFALSRTSFDALKGIEAAKNRIDKTMCTL